MALHFEGSWQGIRFRRCVSLFPIPDRAGTKGRNRLADGLHRAGISLWKVPDRSREQLEEWVLRRIGEEARSIR